MRRPAGWLGVGTAMLLLALAGVTTAAEVPVDSVPQPVQATVEARFPGIEIEGYAQEQTEDGATLYEVTLNEKGKNIDITLTPEGNLILIEREISRKDLPKVVIQAIEKEFPKARYRMVEELIEVEDKKETLSSYEVLLLNKEKQYRAVQLALDGTIMKVEKKGSEEEGEED